MTCKVKIAGEICGGRQLGKTGMCETHRLQWRKGEDFRPKGTVLPKRTDKKCEQCGEDLVQVKTSKKRFCDECLAIRRKLSDKEREKEYRKTQEYKDYYRSYILLKNYGISAEDWDQMFELQGGGCAICYSKTSGWSKGWHTDHCHSTGEVRGVLCHKCNLMLGLARDDTGILESAISYLGKNAPIYVERLRGEDDTV